MRSCSKRICSCCSLTARWMPYRCCYSERVLISLRLYRIGQKAIIIGLKRKAVGRRRGGQEGRWRRRWSRKGVAGNGRLSLLRQGQSLRSPRLVTVEGDRSSSESSRSNSLFSIRFNLRQNPPFSYSLLRGDILSYPSSFDIAWRILKICSSWKASWMRMQKVSWRGSRRNSTSCDPLLGLSGGELGDLASFPNQRCRDASLMVSLSCLGLSSRTTRSFTKQLQLLQASPSKEQTPFTILLMVYEWYSEKKGVCPATSWQSVTPIDHRSTLSSYPPPSSTSGAKYCDVPIMVSISLREPLWKVFLEMPKSITFTLLPWRSQSILSGLISRWQIFRQCICVITLNSSANTNFRSGSGACAKWVRLGNGKCSMTKQATLFLRSKQRAWQRMMLGWRSCLMERKFFFNSRMCSQSMQMIFTAQTFPVSRYSQRCTRALAPSPIISSSVYFSLKLFTLLRSSSSSSSEYFRSSLSERSPSASCRLCLRKRIFSSLAQTWRLFLEMTLMSRRDFLMPSILSRLAYR